MAKTSLGTLYVDLLAKTGGFETDMGRAARVADKKAREIDRSIARATSNIAKYLSAAAVGAGALAIIRATDESEKAISQLNAALQSTGGAVGYTSDQLQEFAKNLQKTSTFGDEAIIGLETRLLSFGNVSGDVFRRATRATIDLSTRLGKDLNSSALQVGKALNDPIKGLAGLSRAGIQFSADQKEVIKALAESGRLAEAQAIILDELERKFGGAAQAARNTFGGALTALKEAFGDLLEAPGGMSDSTKALNEFTDLLQDQATVNAAETLTSSTVQGFTLVTQAIVGSFNALTSWGEKLRDSAWFTATVDYMVGEAIRLKRAWEFALTDRVLIGSGTIDRSGGKGTAKPPTLTPDFSGKAASGGSGKAAKGTKEKNPYADEASILADIDQSIEDAYRERADSIKEIERIRFAALTDEQQAVVKLQDEYVKLAKAVEKGVLSQEEAARISAGLAQQWADDAKEKTEEMSEFAKAAAQNMQSAFADFLFDPFQDGMQGMLMGFVDVLRRMAAEAIAAKIFEMIGSWGTANAGAGGWAGAFASFAKFAGTKDAGGSIPAGAWAMVGERRPELVAGPATVIGGAQTALMMQRSQASRGDAGGVRIVNAIDPRFIGDFMGSAQGEQVILNVVSRNSRRMRSAMGA